MDYRMLTDGCQVLGRCGRAGRSGVEWEAPQAYTLLVQKDSKDRVCLVALSDRDDFVDFDPRYDDEGEYLLSEGYYFEVLKIGAD